MSNTGVLVHASGPGLVRAAGAIRSLTWMGRDGKGEALGEPERSYISPRISPAGTRVAIDTRDADNDVWISDFARKTLTRLTFGPLPDRYPMWTPDAKRIVFASGSGAAQNLFVVAADGTGSPERLTESLDVQFPSSIAPDSTHVVFHANSGLGTTLNTVRLDSSHRVQAILQTPGTQRNGAISPGSRWIAYESLESSRNEIYVRPYPDVQTGRWQVSTNGGGRPVWARNGRELFYVSLDGAVMVVKVEPGQAWVASTPERLFSSPDLNIPGFAGITYDVSPDGRRFLVLKLVRNEEAPNRVQLVVVQNWLEELKRLVPVY